MALPVRRDPVGRARDRLVIRVVLRRGQLRALVGVLRLVAEVPRLAGLEAADERVATRLRVRARVLRGRGVTAADVPALRAPAEVEPPAAGLLAFGAAGPARRDGRVDAWHVGHSGSSVGL